jgi:flagellar biosynthesis protein FlhG
MPDQANNLRELVRQGAVPAPTPPVPRPKLLVITGGARGVGTTTVAVNLAVALARQKRRTLLADADPRRGSVADFLRIEPRRAPPERSQASQVIEEIPQPGPAGLYVLPAALALDFLAEGSAAGPGPLVRPLPALTRKLDFVVVDAGSGPTPTLRQLWQAADVILVVTTTEPVSVMTTYGSIKALVSAGLSLPIVGLVNRAPRRSAAREAYAQLARACRRFLGIRLGKARHLFDDPRVAEAREAGKPLVIGAPRSRVARCFRRLAKTIIRQTKRSAVTR